MRKWLCLLLAATGTLASPNFSRAEMRAAWVASVYNLNFPTKPGLSAETQKAQIAEILDPKNMTEPHVKIS